MSWRDVLPHWVIGAYARRELVMSAATASSGGIASHGYEYHCIVRLSDLWVNLDIDPRRRHFTNARGLRRTGLTCLRSRRPQVRILPGAPPELRERDRLQCSYIFVPCTP